MNEEIEDFHNEIRYGTFNNVKRLLKNGIDINGRDNDLSTALHVAISYNKTDIALFLLENGADVTLQTNRGLTPLHYAAEYDNLAVAEAILKVSTEPLHLACVYNGQPLEIAVRISNFSMLKLLLDNGADKNYGDKGYTAFDTVKSNGIDELTKLFERY